jgi:hypothetical protein
MRAESRLFRLCNSFHEGNRKMLEEGGRTFLLYIF